MRQLKVKIQINYLKLNEKELEKKPLFDISEAIIK
jgi:hypothetical protein